MRHNDLSQYAVCHGKFIATSVVIVCILLTVIVVSLDLSLPSNGADDFCNNNVCVFINPNLPNDISCLNDSDCQEWSHPCHNKNNCSTNGTSSCIYYGMGDYRCACKPDYGGRYCLHTSQRGVRPHSCDYCLHGGSCIPETADRYKCNCTNLLWTGKHCQQIKVSNVTQDMCSLPDMNLTAIRNTPLWYEVARSDPTSRRQDACTSYNFTVIDEPGGSGIIQVDISYIPLNQFTHERRQGRLSHNMTLLFNSGSKNLEVEQQPFLPEHVGEATDVTPMKATLYTMQSGGNDLLVYRLCQHSPMYGKQQFVAIFLALQTKKVEMFDFQFFVNRTHVRNLQNVIQGHGFCKQ